MVRDGSGHFAYDANFVPPLLQTSASPRLMLLSQRLIEILDEKSATITRGASAGQGGHTEFSTREIANFWLLHAVNSALAPLRHLLIASAAIPKSCSSNSRGWAERSAPSRSIPTRAIFRSTITRT